MTSGPRPVRAHRGTALNTLGWPQEAALRMLQNNLDPEVAEHPDELVVYGGTGKAARDWASFDALVRTLETLKGDETMLVQSGRPVGVMQTHEWAPRVLIANSNLVGRLGELGRVPPPREARAHDVRADDGRLVDLHRHAGHPAGHVRDVLGRRRREVRRHPGGHHHADRGPRRHGRRSAARRHHERRSRDLRRRRPVAHRPAHRARLPGCRGLVDRGRPVARIRGPRFHDAPLDRTARQRRRRLPAAARPCGAEIDIVTDQTSAHDPLAYLPLEYSMRGLGRRPEEGPDGIRRRRAREHGEACRGDGRLPEGGSRGLRLRQQHPHRGARRRLRGRVRVPRLRARLHPARCSPRARGRSAGLRSPATRPTSRRPTGPCSSSSPRTSRCTAGSRWRASACTSRGCRLASAGSATASATSQGCGSTTWSRRARSARRS